MKASFYDRLNKIQDRLSSPGLLNNAGLGNEIGFYIFDYPPERELEVRQHIEKIIKQIPQKIAKIDLFDLLIAYLEKRKLLSAALDLQRQKGDDEMIKALKGALDEETRIAPEIVAQLKSAPHDLVVITGVGSVFPLLRTHRLLNCLQPLIRDTPLVVFYPGEYSGQTLSLFGHMTDDNYYRAFRLVP